MSSQAVSEPQKRPRASAMPVRRPPVGMGPGSICTTRWYPASAYRRLPRFSIAPSNCRARHPDNCRWRNPFLRNITKASAAGAATVMIGPCSPGPKRARERPSSIRDAPIAPSRHRLAKRDERTDGDRYGQEQYPKATWSPKESKAAYLIAAR